MNFVCVPALPVYSIRACTGFDGGFEVEEAIRSSRTALKREILNINADDQLVMAA